MLINKVFLLLLMLVLPACSWLRPSAPATLPLPPVRVITETVQLEIYQPPLPPPIQFDDVQWFVITENNVDDKIAEVKRFTGTDFVLFGMTPQSYENMAYNFQESRRYILQLLEIINYYREATKVKGTEGWLEANQTQQNNQLERTPDVQELPPEPETSWFRRILPGR
jgi:hypothetical protein